MDEFTVTRFRKAYWAAFRGLETVRLRQWERSRVTLPRLRVLFAVRRTPGILTTDLARELGTTLSTTSGLVSKLVEQELIERRTASQDRRRAPLHLTILGESLTGELLTVVDPFLLGVAQLIGDDMEQVTRTLEYVADAGQQVWDKIQGREPIANIDWDRVPATKGEAR